jgi:hypothetical protein
MTMLQEQEENSMNHFLMSTMCTTHQESSRARRRSRTLLFCNNQQHQVRRTTKLLLVATMILVSATRTAVTMARPFGAAVAPVANRAFLGRSNARLVSSSVATTTGAEEEEAIVAKYAFIRPASPEDLAQLYEVGFSYSVKHKRHEQQHQQQHRQDATALVSELEMLESDIVLVSGRSDCYQQELQCL